jgi:predicted Zn-dependent protease
LARFCLGENAGALDTLAPVVDRFSEHPPLARLQARILHRLGRHDDAIQALAPLLAAGVNDAEARGIAAVLFHEAGDTASASGARTQGQVLHVSDETWNT